MTPCPIADLIQLPVSVGHEDDRILILINYGRDCSAKRSTDQSDTGHWHVANRTDIASRFLSAWKKTEFDYFQ